MTIITHNASREGAASLRDNISHKYAKRLLSLLHKHALFQFKVALTVHLKVCYFKGCIHVEKLIDFTPNQTLV